MGWCRSGRIQCFFFFCIFQYRSYQYLCLMGLLLEFTCSSHSLEYLISSPASSIAPEGSVWY